MNRTKIVKSFSLYTIGQFLTQALSFILLPIYVSKLSTEEYGIVAFFMAFGVFLNAIMQYGFGATIMRYYFDFKSDAEGFKSFFSSVLIFMVATNIGLILLLSMGYSSLFELLGVEIDYDRYIAYVLGYSFLFTFPILNLTLFRVKDQPVNYLLFNLGQFAMSLAAIYYFVAILDGGALGKIKGEFWARIPLFLISIVLYANYFTIKGLSWGHIRKALKFGIPLMFQSMLWWGLYRLDYFLIENVLGSQYLGLYNVGFQISFVLITVGISFSLAWTPHFFSIAKNKNTPEVYGRLIGNFLMLLVLLASAILFFGKKILIVIGGSEYLGIFEFLPWLLFGAIFQGSYYLIHQTIQYSKRTISIPLILGLGVLIGFFLEYWAIGYFGLIGLGIVKFVVFMAVFLMTFAIGQRFYRMKLPFHKIWISFVILLLNYAATFYFGLDLNSLLIKGGLLLANVVAIWFLLPFFSKEEKNIVIRKFKTI
ncbi:lipopolysaccharide biosynthesis protein [Flagellimonas sp. DF-77]|uniref:lipopolysaccharide biosynthesis protein n=1 Tax=Flagellimonas algarum TaxID=3230298 RepID=UPI0033917676